MGESPGGGALHQLASMLASNRDEEARLLTAEMIARGREGFGPDTARLAALLERVGTMFLNADGFADAEPLLREALEISRGLGGIPPHLLKSRLRKVAMVCLQSGRLAEAERLYLQDLGLPDESTARVWADRLVRLLYLSRTAARGGSYERARVILHEQRHALTGQTDEQCRDGMDYLLARLPQHLESGEYMDCLEDGQPYLDLAEEFPEWAPNRARAEVAVAEALVALSQFEKAAELSRRALQRGAAGERAGADAVLRRALAGLGHELSSTDPQGAIAHLQEALELPDDETTGALELLLGRAFANAGKLDQARQHTMKGLRLATERVGPANDEVAVAQIDLATLDLRQGSLEAAERRLRGLLPDLRSRGSDELTTVLLNLSVACERRSEPAEAEALLRETLGILQQDPDRDQWKFIVAHEKLVALFLRGGRLPEALELQAELVRFVERRQSGSQRHARVLVGLADLMASAGQVKEAAELYEVVVESQRMAGAVGSEPYAATLARLARLKARLGDPLHAEALLQIALAIYTSNLGSESDAALATRAELEAIGGEPATAEALAPVANLEGESVAHLYLVAKTLKSTREHNRAIALLTELIGHCREDPAHARTLVQSRLELAHWQLLDGLAVAQHGEPGEPYFAHADALVAEALRAYQRAGGAAGLEPARGASGPDRYLERSHVLRGLLAGARGRFEEAYRFHVQAAELRQRWRINPTAHQGMVIHDAIACAASGRWPEAVAALRRWSVDDEKSLLEVLAGNNEGALLEYLHELHRLLEVGITLASCPESTAAMRELALDILLRRKGMVADALRVRLAGQSGLKDLVTASARRVSAALEPGTTLVEYARYRRANLRAIPARGEAFWTAPRYFALVLQAGKPDDVAVIDLGDAAAIEQNIGEWLAHMQAPRDNGLSTSDTLDADVFNPATGIGLVSAMYSGDLLRKQVLDPVTSVLLAEGPLVVAPDGAMNLVPFQCLPGTRGKVILESRSVRYITTGRDLLQRRRRKPARVTPPLVVADPDYDWDEASSSALPASSSKLKQPSRFLRLKGAREEGKAVAVMLGVKCQLDEAASRRQVMNVKAPIIAHFATHGFFTPLENPRAVTPTEMLRGSGLALAGANVRRSNLPDESEPGLLTAEDVMGLDLGGTELVVLSACDTGLGEIRSGEGVFGLRRAFMIAGARSLIMSVWRVPDTITRDLMIAFYRNLAKGTDVVGALQAAQLEMRKEHMHPYFWGAFVCIGGASPLSLYTPSVMGRKKRSRRKP